MALTKTTVTGTIVLANEAVSDASLVFTLTGWDTDTLIVSSEPVTVPLGGDGSFSVELWPNERGLRGTQYNVVLLTTLNGLQKTVLMGNVEVPEQASVGLNAILGVTPQQLPDTNLSAAQAAAAAQAARDQAQVLASQMASDAADVEAAADRILAPAAADPATRDDASPLQDGDVYLNTVTGATRIYDGGWVDAVALSAPAETPTADAVPKAPASYAYLAAGWTDPALLRSVLALANHAGARVGIAEPSIEFIFSGGGFGLDIGGGLLVPRSLAQLLADGDLTMKRASTATYFDAAKTLQTALVDEPRLDHDPLTGAPRGMLFEETRTNKLTRSQSNGVIADSIFDGAEIVTDGYGICPASQTRWALDNSAGVSPVTVKFRGATGNTNPHSASIWATIHSLGSTQPTLFVTGTGTISITQTHWQLYKLENVIPVNDASALCVTVPPGCIVNVAAPQLEEGHCCTSYIPTNGAAVTRDSDVMYRAIGSEVSADGGTFVVDYTTEQIDPVASRICSLNDQTDAYSIELLQDADGDLIARARVDSVQDGFLSVAAGSGAHRAAFAFAKNDFAVSVDGGAVSTDDVGDLPEGMTRLSIGASPHGTGAANLNGWITALSYFRERISNAKLQELTA